jgi:hypothetical protein
MSNTGNIGNQRKLKLKQLVWDKITTSSTDKTVWSNTAVEGVQMDLQELESLFALTDATPKNTPTKVDLDDPYF